MANVDDLLADLRKESSLPTEAVTDPKEDNVVTTIETSEGLMYKWSPGKRVYSETLKEVMEKSSNLDEGLYMLPQVVAYRTTARYLDWESNNKKLNEAVTKITQELESRIDEKSKEKDQLTRKQAEKEYNDKLQPIFQANHKKIMQEEIDRYTGSYEDLLMSMEVDEIAKNRYETGGYPWQLHEVVQNFLEYMPYGVSNADREILEELKKQKKIKNTRDRYEDIVERYVHTMLVEFEDEYVSSDRKLARAFRQSVKEVENEVQIKILKNPRFLTNEGKYYELEGDKFPEKVIYDAYIQEYGKIKDKVDKNVIREVVDAELIPLLELEKVIVGEKWQNPGDDIVSDPKLIKSVKEELRIGENGESEDEGEERLVNFYEGLPNELLFDDMTRPSLVNEVNDTTGDLLRERKMVVIYKYINGYLETEKKIGDIRTKPEIKTEVDYKNHLVGIIKELEIAVDREKLFEEYIGNDYGHILQLDDITQGEYKKYISRVRTLIRLHRIPVEEDFSREKIKKYIEHYTENYGQNEIKVSEVVDRYKHRKPIYEKINAQQDSNNHKYEPFNVILEDLMEIDREKGLDYDPLESDEYKEIQKRVFDWLDYAGIRVKRKPLQKAMDSNPEIMRKVLNVEVEKKRPLKGDETLADAEVGIEEARMEVEKSMYDLAESYIRVKEVTDYDKDVLRETINKYEERTGKKIEGKRRDLLYTRILKDKEHINQKQTYYKAKNYYNNTYTIFEDTLAKILVEEETKEKEELEKQRKEELENAPEYVLEVVQAELSDKNIGLRQARKDINQRIAYHLRNLYRVLKNDDIGVDQMKFEMNLDLKELVTKLSKYDEKPLKDEQDGILAYLLEEVSPYVHEYEVQEKDLEELEKMLMAQAVSLGDKEAEEGSEEQIRLAKIRLMKMIESGEVDNIRKNSKSRKDFQAHLMDVVGGEVKRAGSEQTLQKKKGHFNPHIKGFPISEKLNRLDNGIVRLKYLDDNNKIVDKVVTRHSDYVSLYIREDHEYITTVQLDFATYIRDKYGVDRVNYEALNSHLVDGSKEIVEGSAGEETRKYQREKLLEEYYNKLFGEEDKLLRKLEVELDKYERELKKEKIRHKGNILQKTKRGKLSFTKSSWEAMKRSYYNSQVKKLSFIEAQERVAEIFVKLNETLAKLYVEYMEKMTKTGNFLSKEHYIQYDVKKSSQKFLRIRGKNLHKFRKDFDKEPSPWSIQGMLGKDDREHDEIFNELNEEHIETEKVYVLNIAPNGEKEPGHGEIERIDIARILSYSPKDNESGWTTFSLASPGWYYTTFDGVPFKTYYVKGQERARELKALSDGTKEEYEQNRFKYLQELQEAYIESKTKEEEEQMLLAIEEQKLLETQEQEKLEEEQRRKEEEERRRREEEERKKLAKKLRAEREKYREYILAQVEQIVRVRGITEYDKRLHEKQLKLITQYLEKVTKDNTRRISEEQLEIKHTQGNVLIQEYRVGDNDYIVHPLLLVNVSRREKLADKTNSLKVGRLQGEETEYSPEQAEVDNQLTQMIMDERGKLGMDLINNKVQDMQRLKRIMGYLRYPEVQKELHEQDIQVELKQAGIKSHLIFKMTSKDVPLNYPSEIVYSPSVIYDNVTRKPVIQREDTELMEIRPERLAKYFGNKESLVLFMEIISHADLRKAMR